MQTKYTPKDLRRFWGKVITSDRDNCWEWNGCRVRQGYGHWGWGGKLLYSHRVSWEIHFGEIPDGLEVCHSCDNPPCANPNHLFLGTHKQNMEDRDRKKRRTPPCGEKNGQHKVTDAQVVEIRQKYGYRGIGGNGSTTLSREYGVDRNTILRIVKRQSRN